MPADMGTPGEQSIFAPQGHAAAILSHLGLVLTAIALLVLLVMTVLIAVALSRRRSEPEPGTVGLDHFERSARPGVRWIVAGALITFVILAFAAIYSIRVLLAYPHELDATTMTVRITGYQYWWKVQYLDARGGIDVTDADQLHIPVNTRVKLELASADVIHSFWVPGLAGKTDLIPGMHTTMWIDANHAAVYRGQCAEYCGMSHANMRMAVVVSSAADFAAWLANQRRVPAPDSAVTTIFQARGCGGCHSLTGQMHGTLAPDLTHFAARPTIAAGLVANNAANLRAWLLDPQSIKPGTLMPNTGLSPAQLDAVTAYLEQLK